MTVSASSHLYRLSNYWGFTAYAISLGSSYFQVWEGGCMCRYYPYFQLSVLWSLRPLSSLPFQRRSF